MQVQIVPRYVNPPKPGGKMGSVKDQQDGFYLVAPLYLHHFQVGQPINIEYNEKQGNQGPIRFVNKINGQDITGQQGPVQGGDRPAPIPQNVPQDDTAESIFVTGVVGRAMGSGQFGVTDIHVLAKAAVQAWRERHGSPQTFTEPLGPPSGQMQAGQGEPPFNDDLPEQFG